MTKQALNLAFSWLGRQTALGKKIARLNLEEILKLID